jgi:hypothetical protein
MKNAVKRLTKEEVEHIDEVSKSTLMRYIPKASRDVGSHTYAGKEAGEWANHYTRAGDWSAAEKHSKKSYADFKKANKRIAGIDTATKKLGTQKEEVQVDEAAHIYDTKTNKVHSKHDTYNKAIKAVTEGEKKIEEKLESDFKPEERTKLISQLKNASVLINEVNNLKDPINKEKYSEIRERIEKFERITG